MIFLISKLGLIFDWFPIPICVFPSNPLKMIDRQSETVGSHSKILNKRRKMRRTFQHLSIVVEVLGWRLGVDKAK